MAKSDLADASSTDSSFRPSRGRPKRSRRKDLQHQRSILMFSACPSQRIKWNSIDRGIFFFQHLPALKLGILRSFTVRASRLSSRQRRYNKLYLLYLPAEIPPPHTCARLRVRSSGEETVLGEAGTQKAHLRYYMYRRSRP